MATTAFGELLRQARDLKGVTLREAERATRISRTHLSALESEEFTELPPPPYARGIVRNYAHYLGLDPRVALDSFQAATGTTSEPYDVIPSAKPLDIQSHWAPNFAIIAFMVVISAIVFAWTYSAYLQPSQAAPPTTVGVATVTPVSPSLLAQVTVQATVATQGGGVATTTPEIAAPTMTPAAAATETPSPAVEVATQQPLDVTGDDASSTAGVDETTDADVDVSEADVTPSDETDTMNTGASYSFVIWVTADVWVQAIVDGEPVVDEVLASGTELVFEGGTIAVSSGDSAFVHIYVNGIEYGGPDAPWDSEFVYP